jgi:myosin heavy subunit
VVVSPRSRNEYHIKLDVGAATKQRDALVKHVYTLLFNLLVHRMNSRLGTGRESRRFIGLLDVFGFEVPPTPK